MLSALWNVCSVEPNHHCVYSSYTIQCIILHPSYMRLTCSYDVQSHEYDFARAFPDAGFHASLPGLAIPHGAGPDCKHAKLAFQGGLSLRPFMRAKQIASFAAATKPLAKEAIPNVSINKGHKSTATS